MLAYFVIANNKLSMSDDETTDPNWAPPHVKYDVDEDNHGDDVSPSEAPPIIPGRRVREIMFGLRDPQGRPICGMDPPPEQPTDSNGTLLPSNLQAITGFIFNTLPQAFRMTLTSRFTPLQHQP